MDSLDLIARENEFKKLNKQLEKKTISLMKEIENVMHKPDIFTEFSQNITTRQNEKVTKPHVCFSNAKIKKDETKIQKKVADKINTNYFVQNNDMEFLNAFVSVNIKDNVFPKHFSKSDISMESVCKFLASKVKLLQEQVDKLQSTIEKKAAQCEKHLSSQAEMEAERLALLNKTKKCTADSVDIKTKYMALQTKFNEKELQCRNLTSSIDKLSVELKKVKSRNLTIEARCAIQEQTIESLKQQLEAFKMAEKEFKESTRTLSTSHTSAISRLESKISSLNSRIEKQMALIENLRKQNAILITDGALRCLEKDYDMFLTAS